jgi:hypothetical protein
LLNDRYGEADYVSISNMIPDYCEFLDKPEKWKMEPNLRGEMAFLLGTLVRRLNVSRDKLVLRVRSGVADRLSKEIENRCQETEQLKKSKVKLHEGRHWSWITIDSKNMLTQVLSWWPNPVQIPRCLRSLGKRSFAKWCEGARLATSLDEDGSTSFTFLEERQLRQLLVFNQALRQEGYECCPDPKYSPMDVTLKFGGLEAPKARMVSICRTDEELFLMSMKEKYWSPVVNFILLIPSAEDAG